jgi:hypothetical protein
LTLQVARPITRTSPEPTILALTVPSEAKAPSPDPGDVHLGLVDPQRFEPRVAAAGDSQLQRLGGPAAR